MRERLAALLLAARLLPAGALAQADGEKLRAAKALFFDRQYAEAREAWQEVAASGRAADRPAAAYWVARCSESLGESERALGEYGAYLAGRPADRALGEEAKTSRVALAVKLAKAGKKQHLVVALEALADSSRTVRYFAALQVAAPGPEAGKAPVPVLREILAEEKDEDLVERAKLALLRLDRNALSVEAAPAPPAPPPPRAGRRGPSRSRSRAGSRPTPLMDSWTATESSRPAHRGVQSRSRTTRCQIPSCKWSIWSSTCGTSHSNDAASDRNLRWHRRTQQRPRIEPLSHSQRWLVEAAARDRADPGV